MEDFKRRVIVPIVKKGKNLLSEREITMQYILSPRKYLPIKDYAIIGDLHTVALVGQNGSIDWYCLPRIDSPSAFGSLLDAEKGGFFRIYTSDVRSESQQLYYPSTNILLTRFATPDGYAELT
jgi:GH15 family glucan-1,4-alpha-glucosidase